MKKNIRRIALEALMDITDRGAYANLRLKEAQAGLDERDAKWVAAYVYETLDHIAYLDFVIAAFAKGRQKPVVRAVLRMGACELLFLRAPDRVACNESVNLLKQMGKAALGGYVNAVLRSIARSKDDLPPLPNDPVQRLCIAHSWPEWLVKEWIACYGETQTEALLQAKKEGMTLRAQPPFTADELRGELNRRNIAYQNGRWEQDCCKLESGLDIANEPLFLDGRITVQSESAMLVCRACGAKPGMKVLDACAAPGGKTACLAAFAGNDCDLTAFEVHPHRKELLDKTLARLHVNAETKVQDAAVLDEQYQNAFDIVLVDAPCSGLGVAAGKPDIRYAKNDGDIQALAAIQKQILTTCARYVKPGGALLYATCTISRRENELQAEAFLNDHPDFRPGDLSPYLPQGLVQHAQNGMLQLLPSRDGTEGFFLARFEKTQTD